MRPPTATLSKTGTGQCAAGRSSYPAAALWSAPPLPRYLQLLFAGQVEIADVAEHAMPEDACAVRDSAMITLDMQIALAPMRSAQNGCSAEEEFNRLQDALQASVGTVQSHDAKEACKFATRWTYAEACNDVTRFGEGADAARDDMAKVTRAIEAEQVAKHKQHMLDRFNDPRDGLAKVYKYIKGETAPPTVVIQDGAEGREGQDSAVTSNVD